MSPPQKAPVEQDTASVIIRRDAPSRMMAQVKTAFEAAGHDCTLEKDGDVACDERDAPTPSMFFHYLEQQGQVGYLFATNQMDLTSVGSSCEAAKDALADAESMMPALQVRCESDKLILAVSIAVPEAGLSVRELNRIARGVQYIVTNVIVRVKH